MIRKTAYIMVLMFGMTCLFIGVAPGATTNYGSVNNGSGVMASVTGKYQSISSVGTLTTGVSTGTYYRNYNGFMSGQVVAPALLVIDNNMSFVDESPTSSEEQTTTAVTFHVTLQSAGNDIASVYYKFSNSGLDGLVSAPYQYNADTETIIVQNTKIRYRVSFPNNGQTLSVSGDNYIQWFGKNDAGADVPPAIFRIRVRNAAEPAFEITQPDVKGGFTSVQPLIRATVTDQDVVLDTGTIAIKLARADGAGSPVIDMQSSGSPEIYDDAHKIVTYKYNGAPLLNNVNYTLTVSAKDKTGVNSYAATASLTARGGAIADLVPYPSPFDPKLQPIALRYVLNKRCRVMINIYDMGGRLVKNIVDNIVREPGVSEETWDGSNYAGDTLANGVYICEIAATDDDGEHRRYTSLAIFGK
jgi:flagellar hook assembly protein FlgD